MMHITKEQQPLYLQIKEVEKEVRSAAEQAKIFQNSLSIVARTVRKNELTMKSLEKVENERGIYVPLGRAFLKRDKQTTISEFAEANNRLIKSAKDMDQSMKYHLEKVNEKQALFKELVGKLQGTK